MDFYELLDIPQGDRRKYHDDVTIMVISLEGRIWKSSGTYVWCSADILSVSVFILMQCSAEASSASQAIAYMLIERGKPAWHTDMQSWYTCQSGILSSWDHRWSWYQLWCSSCPWVNSKLHWSCRHVSRGGEEFLGKAKPISLRLPPQLSSVTYSLLTIFSTSLYCHRGGQAGAPFILWGKESFGSLGRCSFSPSFMWGMSLYYSVNWNWSMAMA